MNETSPKPMTAGTAVRDNTMSTKPEQCTGVGSQDVSSHSLRLKLSGRLPDFERESGDRRGLTGCTVEMSSFGQSVPSWLHLVAGGGRPVVVGENEHLSGGERLAGPTAPQKSCEVE